MWLVPDNKQFIIFILLCIIALGLGYWAGTPNRPIKMAEKEMKNRPIGIDDRERDFLGVPAGGGGCCLIILFSAIALFLILYFMDFFKITINA